MSALSPISGSLGRRAARHLLRRLTFGPTKQEIDEFQHKSISEALDLLFKKHPHPQPPLDTATGAQWVNPIPLERSTGKRKNSLENTLIPYTRYWWLDSMCKEKTGVTEKMAFFYHSHFTTISSRIFYSLSLYHQLGLFRYHATGNVKSLAYKMCRDNAMLIHLDGNSNEMDSPNENFAREFLELYTIGKGEQVGPDDYSNYTEHDIREAARILSGFKTEHTFSEEIDPESGLPLGRILLNPQNMAIRHDAGIKTFSHRFGNRTIKPKELRSYYDLKNLATKEACEQEVKDLVDMIFDQKETARHFCGKLYRFFVYYDITPEVEREVIEPLATTLFSNNYEMEPVLRQLFSSNHFFDLNNSLAEDNVCGALIKSPLEIMAGTLRFFKVSLPERTQLPDYYELYETLYDKLGQQGLNLYEPFDVAGYTAYHQAPDYNRHWISSNNLAYRYQFAQDLISGIRHEDSSKIIKLDLMQYISNSQHITDPSDAEKLVRELTDDLLPEMITEERFRFFLNEVLLDNLSVMNWQHEWAKYKESGNDTAIRMQIEKLVVALLQSPEYQLF